MTTLKGQILTLPKMSGSVSTPNSLSGNVGAKTINIGGKGDDGATFTPSVSPDGVISWTNDRGLPNPAPVNIKPVRGVDYCTEKDIDYIVKAVLAALGGAESEDATTAELDKAILDTMILE